MLDDGFEPSTYRLAYHYSFHYPFSLWSGLYLHHKICSYHSIPNLYHPEGLFSLLLTNLYLSFRWMPSSLYTFLLVLKGLARYWDFTPFTDFDIFSSYSFLCETPIILKAIALIH